MTDEIDRQQDEQLGAHGQRLARIEAGALPEADAQTGALQRFLLRVPTALTRLALGARGRKDAARPEGIAMATEANFAAQADQDGIVDTGGNLITHSTGQSTFVSEENMALGSNHGLFAGSVDSVEVTAGGAGFTDPRYYRSESVPVPPPVDTQGPGAWSKPRVAASRASGVRSTPSPR